MLYLQKIVSVNIMEVPVQIIYEVILTWLVFTNSRVRIGHGKPAKSWNFKISFSRPVKSWNNFWSLKVLFGRLVTTDDKARIMYNKEE